jgi:hypothetical protein
MCSTITLGGVLASILNVKFPLLHCLLITSLIEVLFRSNTVDNTKQYLHCRSIITISTYIYCNMLSKFIIVAFYYYFIYSLVGIVLNTARTN